MQLSKIIHYTDNMVKKISHNELFVLLEVHIQTSTAQIVRKITFWWP